MYTIPLSFFLDQHRAPVMMSASGHHLFESPKTHLQIPESQDAPLLRYYYTLLQQQHSEDIMGDENKAQTTVKLSGIQKDSRQKRI